MKATSFTHIANLLQTKSMGASTVIGVSVDSRLVKPGELFFALPGAKVDGHAFLKEVAAKGAVGAVVHSSYRGDSYGLPLIFKEDVLQALQDLAKAYLQQSSGKVIAVTGSLGKTTTKDFIKTLLSQRWKVSVSPGNGNSQIGLPLSILNHIRLEDDFFVLEMGMTEGGQIAKLVQIAPPFISLITTIAAVHIGYFASLEEIAKSKAEIFTHPKTKLGIYPKEKDLDNVLSQSGQCSKKSFSTHLEADFSLKVLDQKMSLKDSFGEGALLPILSLPGAHNRHNFLAALSVARSLNLTWKEIAEAQPLLALPERRLQFVEKLGALFLNDSYNASEESVKAALEALPKATLGGKRIAVLGGIVDLGSFSEACYQAIAEHALRHVDLMLCFGEECLPILDVWQSAGRPVIWKKDRKGIVEALREQLQSGDVILLKGSRVKEVWKVLEEL